MITTGGTIASMPQANGDVTATLEGGELLKNKVNANHLRINNAVKLGSFAFSYETLYEIATHVKTALEDELIEGIVITHGTDTLEETAFYLACVTNRSKPIVLTGAQLDASHPSSDGPRNILDAVAIAKTPMAADWGPVVVFSSFIYGARDVRKSDTNALEAFSSPGWGAIGRVDDGQLIIARNVPLFPVVEPKVPASVVLIRLGIGMTGNEVMHMAEGYEGVVIQAFGRGNAHPSIYPEIKKLVDQGIPVVITSRCNNGAVLPVYGNGGGRDLYRSGAWFVGDLSGEKARLLLGLLLANHTPFHQAKSYMQAWGLSAYDENAF